MQDDPRADAGFVAVCAADGKGLEVALLDPGSLEFGSASELPAPLRRLSAHASKGRTVFANDLSQSTAKMPPPGRRSVPESALLAPIIIAGDVAGVIGLINNRQIAGLLGLSIRTIENHRANLMGKLGLVSRVELVNYAEEKNLL